MRFASALVLCRANLCRSPLGASLLQRRLPAMEIQSAGLSAVREGEAAPAEVQALAREAGLELSAHRARVATPEMIANHDLVLVMSASQRQAVSELAPFATGKTLLFAHWLDGIDIPDPYRKSLDAHRQVFVMLSDAADAWHRRLAP
ncbi:low molecular weight protein-tyrosine-phosphatase [Halomonas sp. RT37]|uniref:protein-tyrosine-phosphatase n=1 Tax=Halomonas sp. RT37 TaxID=2950872 RepID=A0AAU7KCQ8_9GAMM